MSQDAARRRREFEDRRSDGSKPKEEVTTVSVLKDVDTLKEAALKASNGGKKRIVGLYLPDGERIVLEEKGQAKDEKQKAKEQQQSKKDASAHISKKDFASDIARKKTNLSEVAHAYNTGRSQRQNRAVRDKRNEEQLDDEEAARKAKAILSKTNVNDQGNYNDLFNFFDVDKDRNWGSIEFAQRMTDIGFHTGVEDAANLLYFAGVRDVDRISYNDFLLMMPKLKAFRRIIEKDAMRHFSRQDDGSGYISLKALREVMDGIAGPEGADPAFVEAILKKADRERTGRIPFDFFIRALFGSPPLIPYKRDMQQARLSQRVLATVGKLCGAAPKAPPPIGDEED